MDEDPFVLESAKKNAINSRNVIGGAIFVSMAVLGGASGGPLSNFIPPESPWIRQAWRSALAAQYFLIPGLIEQYRLRKQNSFKKMLCLGSQLTIFGASLTVTLWSLGVILGSKHMV